MATTITPTALVKNTASANLAMSGGTAFTDATEAVIDYPREGSLLIVINSTYAGANTFTVKAGEFLSSGQGDIETPTAQNGVYFIPVESSRVKDFDGDITVTFGTSNTGFIRAIQLPY